MTEEDENGDDVERTITRSPILTVFDIDQTARANGADDNSTLTRPHIGTEGFGIVDTLLRTALLVGLTGFEPATPGRDRGQATDLHTCPLERHVMVSGTRMHALVVAERTESARERSGARSGCGLRGEHT